MKPMLHSCVLLTLFPFCSAELFRVEAERIMEEMPLIDGHNDLPWQLLKKFNNRLSAAPANLTLLNDTHTNIPKLRRGHVGGQGEPGSLTPPWCPRSVLGGLRALRHPEQRRREANAGADRRHSPHVRQVPRGLRVRHQQRRVDNWLVDMDQEQPVHNGLSDFGKRVVREMNRLGMLVDLAHVSVQTMEDALEVSKAPVIFSHSSAYELCRSRRNVPDNILRRVNQTGGLVMVNFYNLYVSCKKEAANLSQVADHLDHIKKVAGAAAVGFGGDYDGVTTVPQGLEDVSKYPDLVAELLRRKWTEAEVKDALAGNLLRVFRKVEEIRDSLSREAPDDEPIAYEALGGQCRTSYGYPARASASLPSRLPAALLGPLLYSLLP